VFQDDPLQKLVIFCIIICCCFSTIKSLAQVNDSLKTSKQNPPQVSVHSTSKACIFSAIIPGLGQAYNKKYWKIPILYAGFTGLGYLAVLNHASYAKYKNALMIRNDGNANTIDEYENVYSDDNLSLLVDIYRRDRDLCYIGIFAVYLLNIVDATVDAHLYNFDVSDNLSMKWSPQLYIEPFSKTAIAGISINFYPKN